MIKSVERVHKILNLLRMRPEGLTHMQIADLLEIPHSSLSALLSDLTKIQYILLDPGTRRFVLGPQLAILAGGYFASQEVVRIGRPFVTQLNQMVHESVALMIPVGWELLFAVRENGPRHIVRSLQVGDTAPFYALPSGRALLACMPEETVHEYLSGIEIKAYTEHTVTDIKQLKRELKQIQNQGYAYTRNQIKVGVSSFGIPVFNITGKPVASIDVVIPNDRLTDNKTKLITTSMRQVAAELSEQLGFSADLYAGMREARGIAP